MVRLGPRPLSFRVGVPLSSRVDSLLRAASSSRVASRVVCLRALPVFACRCRPALSMGGGAGCLGLLVVPSPRGHSWLVVWSRRCVVVGWRGVVVVVHGWPLTIRQRPCQLWARLLSDRRPGAANEVSEVGGEDDGVATHLPQRLRSFAIVLALWSWGSKRG